MIKQERVKAIVIPIVASLGLLFSTSFIIAKGADGGDKVVTTPASSMGTVPKATCGRGDHTESGLQGQTTPLVS
jgi:hypothetical protein